MTCGFSKERLIVEFKEDKGPCKSPFVFIFPDNDAFSIGFKAPKGKDSKLKLALSSPGINCLSTTEIGNFNFKESGL